MAAGLSARSEIEAQLAKLAGEEASLDARLSGLISSTDNLTAQLNQLARLKQALAGVEDEAVRLAREVGAVAQTADRVGGKVRLLDEEQSRVKDSIEMVQAVQDLKTSMAGVNAAIAKEDWESATRSMQRAMAVDELVTNSGFAEAVVPSSELPLSPPQTITALRATLVDTFLTSFKEATAAGDEANTSRFFKLFPIIGEEVKGLEVYSEWVCSIVRGKSGTFGAKSSSPTHFAALLTSVFESVALIVSQHQPVVAKYYGSREMISVMQALMVECSRLGMQILRLWEDERRIQKKMFDMRDSRFAFLGSMTLPAGGAKGRLPNQRQGTGRSPPLGYEEERVDPRDIDALLVELAMMSGRWQLLRRFLHERIADSLEEDEAAGPSVNLESPVLEKGGFQHGPESAEATNGTPKAPPVPKKTELELSRALDLVDKSDLGSLLSNHLKNIYESAEIWYLRTSIEKAHAMDEPDIKASPVLSSSVDDIFYILKKTLYRLVSTSSIAALPSVCAEVKKVLERDVAAVWKTRMDGAFKDVGNVGGVGRAREEEKERREREACANYIVYLNDLDVASDYLGRLVDELLAGESLDRSFFLESELEHAQDTLMNVRNLDERLKSVQRSSLDQLFNQLLRPKIRQLLADVYRDVSYILDEDTYAEAEYQDQVKKRFVRLWGGLLSDYKEAMTPNNFNLFLSTSVNVLVRPWEGMVRGMRLNELGAIRLDRDLRSILSFLTSQSSLASGSFRDSFSRLQQIATLLTLDSPEEAEEVLSATGNRLTQAEVKSILSQRV